MGVWEWGWVCAGMNVYVCIYIQNAVCMCVLFTEKGAAEGRQGCRSTRKGQGQEGLLCYKEKSINATVWLSMSITSRTWVGGRKE